MNTRGYIGLISILIGVGVTVLLFTYMYLKPHPSSENKELERAQQEIPQAATATTQMDQLHGDINAANDLRGKANKYNDAIDSAMD